MCAVYGLRSGEALALAMTLARRWGYHGRKAIFCKETLSVEAVRHHVLPGSWWRRSMLELDARAGDVPLRLIAVSPPAPKHATDPQIDHLRTRLAGSRTAHLMLEPNAVWATGIAVSEGRREPVGVGFDALLADFEPATIGHSLRIEP